jgi:uncharacterized protein (DUF58 family)
VAHTPAHTPILDREFLERLERLAIHWQRSFAGLVGGHNRSHFAGGGQEFLDHRQFHQGDDLRAVNWRAYMRLDKMFLKMFQIEPRVPVRLLLDTSVSMGNHSQAPAPGKFEYALRLCASLCYVGLVRLDTIEVLPFAGDLHEGKACGGGRHRFSPLSQFLQKLKPSGSTNFLKVVKQFLNEYPQRGLVIVVSDFLDESGCDKALQYLADYGNELMLIQLWTEEDRTPRFSGEYDFIDAETSARLRIQVDADARRQYTAAFDRFAASIRTVAFRNNGRYAGLETSTPLEDAIFGELLKSQVIA